MHLDAGVRVGPYEIVELIGAGGMGQVYRARDPRLKRDIAVKILPPGWSANEELTQRFQREAELLAALNHPAIAAIYGVEEAGGIKALLLELVEGPTLADILATRALPVRAALPIIRQLIDALDAAHERGIVHRDLKPANIKVRTDGTVKVLDFGLGKIVSEMAVDGDVGTQLNDGQTRAGVILGTAAYMSPEQVRGQSVDRRTDIWAFGCVVYEMLTGRPAFEGATGSDTIAAILDREPEWSRLPGGESAPLARLIRRCLEKDRKLRLRDIADARIDLDVAVEREDRPHASAGERLTARPWLGVAVGLALVVATAAVTLGLDGVLGGGSEPIAARSSQRMELVRATADGGVSADPALSSDGSLLAYASDRDGGDDLDIWVQQTAGSAPLQITNSDFDEFEPSFFPDGSRVVYRAENENIGIYVAPTFGKQEPRLLVSDGRRPRVSPDGRFVAYWIGGDIGFNDTPRAYRTYIIPAAGGEPREIDGFSGARYPVWSPDGRSLLILASRAARPVGNTYDWWRVPIDGGEPAALGAAELLRSAGIESDNGNFSPDDWRDDRVLFSDGRYIWSIRLDPQTGTAEDVERVTFGTNRELQATSSASGLVAIASASVTNSVWALPIDAGGAAADPPRRLTSGSGIYGRASISRDGRFLAYLSVVPSQTILVKNLATDDIIDLGIAGSSFGPAISPDGAVIAYEEGGGVRVVSARGGTPRTLCESCLIGEFTPDSRSFVVVIDWDDSKRLQLIDVTDGAARDLIVSSDGRVNRPFPSPDGRWLAFRLLDPSVQRVFLAPWSTNAPTSRESWIEVVAPESDARPIGWSPDSALLYFVSARDGSRCLYALRIDRVSGAPVGPAFAVRHFHGARDVLPAGSNVLSTGPGNAVSNEFVLYDISDLSANIWFLRAR